MDLGLPVPFLASGASGASGARRVGRVGRVRGLMGVPTFCRHNRLIQNCTICSREQNLAMRPIVSGGTSTHERTVVRGADAERPGSADSERSGSQENRRAPRAARQASTRSSAKDLHVRRLSRGADDGFRSSLAPGLRSSEDAERLAQEVAFAARRLNLIETAPEGLWRSLADSSCDREERSWLAFLIAYVGPDDSADPFAGIDAVRTSWASGESPNWEAVQAGPRGAFDRDRCDATVAAYRGWALRAGSQVAAFTGESAWTAERRFERVYERLALPGMTRDARFELLVLLGRTGIYDLRAGKLMLTGENEVTWAAKRLFGIGDALLLERRAADLAAACQTPLEALDLALHNWGSGSRNGAGLPTGTEPDAEALARAQDALGLR